MGFMDKAKKLAEQAQQKLDEAQNQFNQGAGPQSQQPGGVRYDEHGRPIQDGPPAGTAPPPPPPAQPPATPDAATPASPSAPAAPAEPPAEPAGEAEAQPQATEPPPPPPPPPGGQSDANATPDPFKPLQQ